MSPDLLNVLFGTSGFIIGWFAAFFIMLNRR